MSVDKSLLRQAAERVRDAAPDQTLETLRHLQACFGWETVLKLLDEADLVAGAPMSELLSWAKDGQDRVFEVRYITEAPHPWAVELSDDAISWSAVASGHSELGDAVGEALELAAEEALTT